MEITLKLIFLAVLAGLSWLIYHLANNKTYQKSMNALKTFLAIILGFATTFFLPRVYLFICSYTISLLDLAKNTAAILLAAFSIAGFVASVIAGIYVYYFLCNKTLWGGRLGYLLYGMTSVFCIICAYEQILSIGDRITGLGWIAAMAAGLGVTKKLSGDFSRYVKDATKASRHFKQL